MLLPNNLHANVDFLPKVAKWSCCLTEVPRGVEMAQQLWERPFNFQNCIYSGNNCSTVKTFCVSHFRTPVPEVQCAWSLLLG